MYDGYSGSEKWFTLTVFPAGKGPRDSSGGTGCLLTGGSFTWHLLLVAGAIGLCGTYLSRRRHAS